MAQRYLHPIAIACFIALTPTAACRPSQFDQLVGDEAQTDAGVHGEGASDAGRDSGTDGRAEAGEGGESGEAGEGGESGEGGRPGGGPVMDASREGGAPPDDAGSSPASDGGPPADDGGASGCSEATDRAAVNVTANDLGAITVANTERSLVGPSARLGERVLWMVDVDDGGQRALWTQGGAAALALPEPAAAVPVLPAAAVPEGKSPRINSIIAVDDSSALLYFAWSEFFAIGGAAGLARIGVDQVEAEVILAAGQLFPEQTAAAWFPVFNSGGFVHDEEDGRYVYLYACHANPGEPSEQAGGAQQSPCRLTRVELARAGDAAAYRYWSGSAWTADIGAAAVAIARVPANNLSVAYNRYLRAFLAVHSEGAANQISLRWSERPEGPWHPLKQIETPASASASFTYTFGAIEHPSLRDACHTTLYVTYELPMDVSNGASEPTPVFETRLMRVELE